MNLSIPPLFLLPLGITSKKPSHHLIDSQLGMKRSIILALVSSSGDVYVYLDDEEIGNPFYNENIEYCDNVENAK